MKCIWTFILFGFVAQPIVADFGIVPCEESAETGSCTIEEPSE